MLDSAIREIAASPTSTFVVAGFFERKVQIWDLHSLAKINEFRTVFCAGAENLAIARFGDKLVTGTSTTKGEIACYELPSGGKLWERRLIYPSKLRLHSSEESIWCTENRQSVVRLDIRTGDTLEVIQGRGLYIEDPSGDTFSSPANNGDRPFQLVAQGRELKIAKLGFAVLDVRFSPQSLCLSEARGPVRCISRVDGKLKWMFDPGSDCQVLRLHYSTTANLFYGILKNLNEERSRQLVRLDPNTGVTERVCDFEAWEQVFVDTADQLVTSRGEIRSLLDGTLVGQLAFPSREYPDE